MGDLVDPKPTYDDVYEPQDALGASIRSAALTGAAGTFLAAVQNTVAKENYGPFGVFTRFGKTIGLFGMSWIELMDKYCVDFSSDTPQPLLARPFSSRAPLRQTCDKRMTSSTTDSGAPAQAP